MSQRQPNRTPRRSGLFAGLFALLIVVLLVGAVLLYASAYTVGQGEQAVVVQFGDPVRIVKEPGLHFKQPFTQEVRRFSKKLLVWDGAPNEIPTASNQFIFVDTTARWRIVDPLQFLKSVGDETGAQGRLDDILDSTVREKISETDLPNIVRDTNFQVSREDLVKIAAVDPDQAPKEQVEELTKRVTVGRQKLTREILDEAKSKTAPLGIELVDLRIKRLNYRPDVQETVYDRMISDQQRIAEKFRSEGQGKAAEINGQTALQLAEIQSEAGRAAEVIRGTADAQATKIYNDAFGADPEFYAYFRTLESYANTMGPGTTLVLGTDSAYFRFLQSIDRPTTRP